MILWKWRWRQIPLQSHWLECGCSRQCREPYRNHQWHLQRGFHQRGFDLRFFLHLQILGRNHTRWHLRWLNCFLLRHWNRRHHRLVCDWAMSGIGHSPSAHDWWFGWYPNPYGNRGFQSEVERGFRWLPSSHLPLLNTGECRRWPQDAIVPQRHLGPNFEWCRNLRRCRKSRYRRRPHCCWLQSCRCLASQRSGSANPFHWRFRSTKLCLTRVRWPPFPCLPLSIPGLTTFQNRARWTQECRPFSVASPVQWRSDSKIRWPWNWQNSEWGSNSLRA